MALKMRMTIWDGETWPRELETFLRSPPVEWEADAVARRALAEVRRDGDAALVRLMRRFNGVTLCPARFRVADSEFERAGRSVSPGFRKAVAEVLRRVTRFARAGLRKDWFLSTPRGGRLGERFVPLGRVGVYVPGGVSPLASTALMTIPLARAAGVTGISVCTPCGPDGAVDPHILYACQKAGASELYRLGGIQAIGALAYGTATVPRVDKIVGPGGAYVAAAKRLVYGEVAIDMVAGPSEIAVLCDGSARPDQVAADLLSQAEHGTGRERTLCVTASPSMIGAVIRALDAQGSRLPRWDRVRGVLERNSMLVLAPDLKRGVELIDRFAPEHLELMVRNPRSWVRRIRHAGAIFVGPWTPESAGDFAAGPSHVLPTGGSARYFSGLTVEDFRRRISVLELRRRDLEDLFPAIEEFSRVEHLPAHGDSARRRLRPAGRANGGNGL